jgi:hypothetical protein
LDVTVDVLEQLALLVAEHALQLCDAGRGGEVGLRAI